MTMHIISPSPGDEKIIQQAAVLLNEGFHEHWPGAWETLESALQEVREMLAEDRIGAAPAGALLFSCNGRGMQLFDAPHHDVRVAREKMPGAPVAGFFLASSSCPRTV